MKSLSIRGVDHQLATLLKREAAVEGRSLNAHVLDLLKKHFGLEKEKRFSQEYHDLDELFGRWSANEKNLIQEKIEQERQIDQELWK